MTPAPIGDCFVAWLLAMTGFLGVIASEAKQSPWRARSSRVWFVRPGVPHFVLTQMWKVPAPLPVEPPARVVVTNALMIPVSSSSK